MAGGKRACTDGRTSEQGETGPGRGGNMKQDYREYHFSGKEIAKYLLQSLLLCGALDYLFYQNKRFEPPTRIFPPIVGRMPPTEIVGSVLAAKRISVTIEVVVVFP